MLSEIEKKNWIRYSPLMRSETTHKKVETLMAFLGESAQGPGKIHLVGGATAVLIGWRDTTMDIDLKLDPEPRGVFDAIAAAKDKLDINIELASPDQFIPALDGWQERSQYIGHMEPSIFIIMIFTVKYWQKSNVDIARIYLMQM